MSKVQVTSQIELDVEEVLRGIAHLGTTELEQFVNKVIALQAQRRAPSLPPNEADLIQKINRGIPPKVRRRYHELNKKLHEETITREEHQEMLGLIDQIELADAERMSYIIALAQLRNLSIDDLMDQLGIRRPAYA